MIARQQRGGTLFATAMAMLALAYVLFRSVVDEAGVFYDGQNWLLGFCLVMMIGAAILLPIAGRLVSPGSNTLSLAALGGVAVMLHAVVWAGSSQLQAHRFSTGGDVARYHTQITVGMTDFLAGLWLFLIGLAVVVLENAYEEDLHSMGPRAIGAIAAVLGVMYMLQWIAPGPLPIAIALCANGAAMMWRTRSEARRLSASVAT